VANNENREQEVERLKEKHGVDEMLVHLALRWKKPVNLADVKREFDRAMIETLDEIEARRSRVEP